MVGRWEWCSLLWRMGDQACWIWGVFFSPSLIRKKSSQGYQKVIQDWRWGCHDGCIIWAQAQHAQPSGYELVARMVSRDICRWSHFMHAKSRLCTGGWTPNLFLLHRYLWWWCIRELTEIYHESCYTNSVTFILHPHQCMQQCPNSFMVSRRLLWAQIDVILEMDDNNSFLFRKTHHEPIKTWNVVDGQKICLKLYCDCGPADNPAQSKVCGHIRAKRNFPCWKCNIGGSQKEKEANEGFHKFFFVCLFILQPYLCL